MAPLAVKIDDITRTSLGIDFIKTKNDNDDNVPVIKAEVESLSGERNDSRSTASTTPNWSYDYYPRTRHFKQKAV